MQLDRWGGWITLFANLGVVAGLVFLGLELQDNSQVTRAEAATARLASQIAAETAFMGEDAATAVARAMATPDELSDREILQVWAYLNAAMLAIQQSYEMHRLGLATEEDWDGAVESAADWLGFPFGRVWWDAMKTNYPPELADAVDAQIDRADPKSDYWLRQLRAMREGARQLRLP